MYTLVGQWLQIERSSAEEKQRLANLEIVLKDYGFHGDHLFILKAYEDYKRSSVYPFAGGRGEQPQWVLDDFDTLSLLEEREWLRKKHGSADGGLNLQGQPPPAPLPKFRDIIRQQR